MKKQLVITLLMLTAFTAASQITHTSNGAVDLNAEKILKKASQAINSDAISFTITMINKNSDKKETARRNADILYNKGKYRVTFGSNIIYCDGTATWHWNKDDNEVVVNKMSASEDDLMNPAAILANYKKNFNAKYIRTEQNGDAIIDMTPKKSKSYYKIRLVINSADGSLKKMEMHNYDGSCAEYVVSNLKGGVKTTPADFTFNSTKNPGVEIIDMR